MIRRPSRMSEAWADRLMTILVIGIGLLMVRFLLR